MTNRSLLAIGAVLAVLTAAPAAAQPRDDVRGALERIVAAGAPGAVAVAGGRPFAAGVALDGALDAAVQAAAPRDR